MSAPFAVSEVSQQEQELQAQYDLAIRSMADFVVQAWAIIEPGTEFVWNWHVGVICDVLEDAFFGVPPRHNPEFGRIRELVICIPPRHLKSRIVSVMFQAWAWLHRPGWRVINIANEQSLSTRDARDLRILVQSDWYRRLLQRIHAMHGDDSWEVHDQWQQWFVDCLERTDGEDDVWDLADDQNQKVNFANTKGGYRICLSVGSNITGKGADCLLIDDPYDAKKAIRGGAQRTSKHMKAIVDDYDQVWKSRLNDRKTGLRITIMQRLHSDDLAGVLIKRGAYAVVLPTEYDPHLPAEYGGPYPADPRSIPGELLNPLRMDAVEVRSEKSNPANLRNYMAQHGQRPTLAEGGLWLRAWTLQRYSFDPQRPPEKFDAVVLSGDTAAKDKKTNDPWSIQVWGVDGANRYLLDNLHKRFRYPAGKQALKDMYQKWKHVLTACLIEDASSGMQLVQDLENEIPVLIGISPTHYGPNKEFKAELCSPLWAAGNIWLPAEADWLADYVQEITSFPDVSHDDQVDATTQALLWIKDKLTHVSANPYADMLKAWA